MRAIIIAVAALPFGLWTGIGSNHPHKPFILLDQ